MDTVSFRDLAVEEFDTRTLLIHAREQAAQRRYEDFFIADIDGHHFETLSFAEIVEFIEDPVMRDQAKYQGFGGGGIASASGGYQELAGRITRRDGRRPEKIDPGQQRDRALTRRWMDAIGIDQLCLFPTPMLGLGLTPRPEVEVAMARAYNRWLCERVLAEEPRIKSSLYLPINDPEATYKMVKDFGGKKGVIGFTICSPHYKAVYDNAYMKTYALIEEMGLPLVFHGAYAWGQDKSFSLCNRFIAVHALGFSWFNILHCTNWLVNGMPERLPKLKVVWIESGLAWIPFLMQRLDNEWMMRSSEVPLLKRRPSDYMREMYYSTQPMEMVNNKEALELTFKMINAETQLMYASDYPHWDMDLPSTIYDLPFLNETAKRNILGGNARRVFNLEPAVSELKLKRRTERGAA
ncbi:MAG TPA: amidohydrolase family protein [Stellaceae bacterium]|jgi:predicted TIM-barrel fold metal-dependent hydrolase|nr:amidohydrolase family protein [Stellaceae bacterium]